MTDVHELDIYIYIYVYLNTSKIQYGFSTSD